MVKRYKLIKQDTFKKLELGKVYKIKNERYIVSDENESIILYCITRWQLKNMFEEVK